MRCSTARCARWSRAGFEQYEVSGYARAGARCAHNLNYWTFGDYLGIGAGAHGKITDPSRGLIVRTQQTREPRRYLAADPRSLVTKADRRPGFAVRVRDEWLSPGGRIRRRAVRGPHRAANRRPGAGAGAARGPRAGGAEAQSAGAQPPKASDFSTRYWSSCCRGGAAQSLIAMPGVRAVLCTDAHARARKQGDYGRFQFCCRINMPQTD